MDKIIGVITLLVFATIISVVLSKRSNTAKVLNVLLGGIADLQRAAIAPITGK